MLKYIARTCERWPMNFAYRFPAVKGIQAGREYYITTVSYTHLDVYKRQL